MTSPYKRAVQTAQLAAEILEYKGDLLRTKALEPSSAPKAVWDEIRVHKDEARILLSGHEPAVQPADGLSAWVAGSASGFQEGRNRVRRAGPFSPPSRTACCAGC